MDKGKNKKKKKKTVNNNFIFVLVFILIIVLIVILSLNVKSKNDIYSFNSSSFQNITSIGVHEFKASMDSSANSIIFFCSNEDKKCNEELKELDEIAKEEKVTIEYVNVLELVDIEKEELSQVSEAFKNNYYPNLVIIKNGEIVNNINVFLNREEILDVFKNLELI